MANHTLDDSVVHAFWDNSYPARLEVEPKDTVTFECREASDGQVTPQSDHAALAALDFSRIHPLTGPVFVKGARPGHVLEVEILESRLSSSIGDSTASPVASRIAMRSPCRSSRSVA